MTVAELAKKLRCYPQGHQVILSRDAEGNGFSPLHEPSCEKYEADTTYSGYLEDSDDGSDTNAVVLWPVN